MHGNATGKRKLMSSILKLCNPSLTDLSLNLDASPAVLTAVRSAPVSFVY
jgi:hypothetical protein